jgi:hypothetical protein
MANNTLNQLIGLAADDLELLKLLGQIGAATADEAALKMNRPGDDLTPQMNELARRKLLETRTTTIGNETVKIYLVDPLVQKTLKQLA